MIETPHFKFKKSEFKLLDQTQLPLKEDWVLMDSLEDIMDAIIHLKVRGAPAIGLAAALFIAKESNNNRTKDELLESIATLRTSRPTAVNLFFCMDILEDLIRSMDEIDPTRITERALDLLKEDIELCEKIADHGQEVIQENDHIMTICNTGALATGGRGTALGVISKSIELKRKIKVTALETRPLLQGGRLTAWELQKMGADYQLITDSMAAVLMKEKQIDKIIVGADRIDFQTGSFANKIGTYNLAVLAKHHGVPFYVAAPYSTVDFNPNGFAEMEIEERNPKEVRGVFVPGYKLEWSLPETPCFNPAFDITPGELITGAILDRGVFLPSDFPLNRS